jgi:hypothetical protein
MSRKRRAVEYAVSFNRGELVTLRRFAARVTLEDCSNGRLWDIRPLIERIVEKLDRALSRGRG